jgi:hypothetical protein
MEGLMKGFCLLLLLIGLSAGLTGCGDSKPETRTPTSGVPTGILDGSWKLTEATCDGAPGPLEGFISSGQAISTISFSGSTGSRNWVLTDIYGPGICELDYSLLDVSYPTSDKLRLSTTDAKASGPGCPSGLADDADPTIDFPFDLQGDTLKITMPPEAVAAAANPPCGVGSAVPVFIYQRTP